MTIKQNKSEYAFQIFNYIFFAAIVIVCLYPMMNVLSKAVSAEANVMAGDVTFYPVNFQLETMEYLVKQYAYRQSMAFTILVTLLSTAVSMIVTVMFAYPMSKKDLLGKKVLMVFVVFTMLFSGGLIPSYLLIKQLGLLDKIGALILPGAISPFLLIILKNFFTAIPDSFEESARIDGASSIKTLVMIIVPLSKPALASVLLFYAVGRWNGWFDATILMNSPDHKMLQVYLREIIIDQSNLYQQKNYEMLKNRASQSLQGASIFLSTIPILVVYPFLQKYFVKGIMIGGVKG